jgi:hypothetical protein
VGRISVEHVANAVGKLQQMDMAQKTAIVDEIHEKQPNLLASCVVQRKLGADDPTVEFLLNLLLTCYLAMQESGFEWPLIGDTDQERELQRSVGSVLFSEQSADPATANVARSQYISEHPEQPLLALVVTECNAWLQDIARRKLERESDKYVMMASVNWVDCIARSDAQRGSSFPR